MYPSTELTHIGIYVYSIYQRIAMPLRVGQQGSGRVWSSHSTSTMYQKIVFVTVNQGFANTWKPCTSAVQCSLASVSLPLNVLAPVFHHELVVDLLHRQLLLPLCS